MNYKIVEKPEFKIIGKQIRVRNDNGDNFRLIPEFWGKCINDGTMDVLHNLPNIIDRKVCMGMCADCDGSNTFSYIICVQVENFDTLPEGMTAKTIPAAKYAVFTAKGTIPQAIQDTIKYIYSKWFTSSGYVRAETEDFEYYDERSVENNESTEVDIYIPVK